MVASPTTCCGSAGVLQIEAMAQLAGICMLDPEAEKKDQFFFGGIENCRWRKPVIPGDTLVRSGPAVPPTADHGPQAQDASVGLDEVHRAGLQLLLQ